MKKALCLLAAFGGAALVVVRADPAVPTADIKPSAPLQPPPSGLALPVVSTDVETTDPELIAEQTLALQARQEQQPGPPVLDNEVDDRRKNAEEQDWMLRDYEAALEKKGLAHHTEQDPFTLPIDPVDPATANASSLEKVDVDPLLPLPDAEKKKVAAPAPRVEQTPVASTTSSALAPTELAPLLPPLTAQAPDLTQDHGLDGMITPTDSTSSSSDNGSILDVPGMTAATQDGLISTDTEMDDRPDQPDSASKSHGDEDNFILPTAPKNDVSDFMQKQSESLRPPTAPTAQTVVTAPTVLPPAPAPKPQPVTTGLRTHIADPMDYLNR